MSAIIISVMALIFSSSSRRCGNVRKRSKGVELWETVFAGCGKADSFSIRS